MIEVVFGILFSALLVVIAAYCRVFAERLAALEERQPLSTESRDALRGTSPASFGQAQASFSQMIHETGAVDRSRAEDRDDFKKRLDELAEAACRRNFAAADELRELEERIDLLAEAVGVEGELVEEHYEFTKRKK